MRKSKLEEYFFQSIMLLSVLLVIGSIASLFISVTIKGLPALNIDMITKTPKGGFYLGKEGGILNAIVGSLYLALGSTILSFLIGLPIAFYLIKVNQSRVGSYVRAVLNILCGIPSIVYGAFIFTLMITLSSRSSLLWGIIAVTLFQFPIMTRAFDEVFQKVPKNIVESSVALGATGWETTSQVVTRQTLPGILSAVLLSFGRAIGDAAAVLLTAGYTDNIPSSLMDQVATLPLAVFFQLSSPILEVQQRGYASGIIMLVIVISISFMTRWGSKRLMMYVVR